MTSYKHNRVSEMQNVLPPAGTSPGKAAFRRRFERLPGRAAFLNAMFLSFLCTAAIAAIGCSALKPQLGAISVTGSNSVSQSSVVVSVPGSPSSVNVTVGVANDGTNLGVNWSLVCGGSPTKLETTNVCGTMAPVYAGNKSDMTYTAPYYVPIGNTVTLTATATSDPSQSASVILTIVPKPITIAFPQSPSLYAPLAAMAAGATAQIAATVNYDPTAAGVNWSCAPAGHCGSFSITQAGSGSSTVLAGSGDFVYYTAPAAIPATGTITVTATSAEDSTKSISATIAIMPIAVTVSSQYPSSTSIPAGTGTETLTATVTYDVSNAGVTWPTPLCGAGSGSQACGSVTPNICTAGVAPTFATACTATYTAPNSIPTADTTLPVTVTATSITGSANGSAIITIGPPPPIAVTVTAAASSIQLGGQTLLTATVANDFSNAGVTWQCPSSGSCSVTTSTAQPFTTTYQAPSSIPSTNPVSVTATANACLAAPSSTQCSGNSAATGTASITVVPIIAVTITPPATITAGSPATFSAMVANDIGNSGVDWTASCTVSSICGTFSPTHSASGDSVSFTALNNIPWNESLTPTVTITATSTASRTAPPLVPEPNQMPGTGVTDPVAVTVIPVTYVHFVPFAPSSLLVGNPAASTPTLISLIAAAANDSTNQGVDWTVSCADASPAACGQFLKAPELVATTTPPITPAVAAVYWPYSAKVHAASGQAVAYQPPTQKPTGSTVTITVASTASPSASATQTITMASSATGTALSGIVQVGSQPVPGACVQLYMAGSTGYGSAASPLLSSTNTACSSGIVTSDGTNGATAGSFVIPAGTCTSLNSLVYVVATGGLPQYLPDSANDVNPRGLMTALGPCGGLNSSLPIIVNEVTTVASVYALAPFIGADYAHIGSSSANYNNGPNVSNASNYNNGLANAFATVNNLVDITTGLALSRTPAGNGTVPQAEINTLADAIDTCAATEGYAATGGGYNAACTAFFQASNVNPPDAESPTSQNAPTTILQAIVEVAQVPSTADLTGDMSGGPLYSLVTNPSFTPPFTPILAAAPYDWSIALSFTGGGLEGKSQARPQSVAMALDASGSLWIANKNISSVTELSNLGAALSPFATGNTKALAGGFTGGGINVPRNIAIDPYGNAWLLNTGSTLSELNSAGTPITGANSPFSGGGNPGNTGMGLAIDELGNVWVADSGTPGDVAEYAGYNGGMVSGAQVANGTPLSPAGIGYPIASAKDADAAFADPNGAIAVDDTGDVWVLDGGNSRAVELSSTGTVLDTDQGDQINSQTSEPFNPPQSILGGPAFGVSMAIDNAGDIFIPDSVASGNAVTYELRCGNPLLSNCAGYSANYGGLGQTLNYGTSPAYAPIAVDGAGRLWQVVETNVTTSPVQPVSLVELPPSSSGEAVNYNGQAPGFVASTVSGAPTGIAVDASGNVWVLSGAGSSTVTQFVGVAAPVVMPLSVGAQKNKLGAKP